MPIAVESQKAKGVLKNPSSDDFCNNEESNAVNQSSCCGENACAIF